jgi:hypothetical protein
MSADWERIGAIAELTGSIGVILTLVYVALQIKQATVGMRVAAKQEMTRQYNEFVDTVIENADLAELFIAGNEGGSLDRTQKFRYFAMLEKATWQFSSMYFQQRHQKLPTEEWHQTKMLVQRTCTSIGYRKWWLVNKHYYEPEFIDLIEKLQSDTDT